MTKLFTYLILATIVFASCQKPAVTPALQTGVMVDQDGNTYPTVKIGNQWWMAHDLNTKHYRNGDKIIEKDSTNFVTWTDTVPGYAILNQSVGYLYNGYAVLDNRNLAPKGWHIPTDEEWKTLESTLGMSITDQNKYGWRGTDEAIKLKKSTETVNIPGSWTAASNVYLNWPTNASGFTALGTSVRMPNGRWGDTGFGSTAFYWTNSLFNSQLFYRYLDYDKTNVFRFYGSLNYGMSVRCVKD